MRIPSKAHRSSWMLIRACPTTRNSLRMDSPWCTASVDGVENLWLQPLDGRPGHQITNFPDDVFTSYFYSPDGRVLAMLRRHAYYDVVLLRDTTDATR